MHHRYYTAALAVAAAALAGYLTVHSIGAITAMSPSFEQFEDPAPTIVIDAGHGGFDGGATGINGAVEKDINLAIAQKLYDLFLINGFDVRMTRSEDAALNDEGLSTLRKKKNSDIHNRLQTAKDAGPSILISIHQNHFTESRYDGAQVFYGPKNEESAAFGLLMQERLREMLQPENTRQAKACTDSVYLIYNAPMPALLVECGFLSNPQDAQKLTEPEYQRKVAFAVFSATAEMMGMRLEEPAMPQEGETRENGKLPEESPGYPSENQKGAGAGNGE